MTDTGTRNTAGRKNLSVPIVVLLAGAAVILGLVMWGMSTERRSDGIASGTSGRTGSDGQHATDSIVQQLVRKTPPQDNHASSPEPKMGDLLPIGEWVDVLKWVDVRRDTFLGEWEREGDSIKSCPGANNSLQLPVTVQGSYDLEVVFTRSLGEGPIRLALPVDAGDCTLVLSAGTKPVSGLDHVEGRSVHDNPTTRPVGPLENDRENLLLVQVRLTGDDASVDVKLNAEPYIYWNGKQTSLRSWEGWRLPESNRLGLGAEWASVTFQRVRVRRVSELVSLTEPTGCKALANSVTDFNDVQGGGRWFYGFYDGNGPGPYTADDFEEFPRFDRDHSRWMTESSRFAGDDGEYWTAIWSLGGHTNKTKPDGSLAEHWAVRRWVSNVAGRALIVVEVRKASRAQGGDGIDAHVFVDGEVVWSQHVSSGDDDGTGDTIRINLDVGTKLDFAIAPRSSSLYDRTVFTARIYQLHDRPHGNLDR